MAGMIVRNKYVVIKHHIDEAPRKSDFAISEQLISLNSTNSSKSKVVVKNLYVSIDPYLINCMKTQSNTQILNVQGVDYILPGQEIRGSGVGEVVYSKEADFGRGDLVLGLLSWGEYTLVEDGRKLLKLDNAMGFPLSYYAGGVLGMCSCFSAYTN
ncbi:Zinc-binding dehydrogenase family protein [Striga hermonthica]|uniref:Zinc-binding dehydrogenase family protein n=1 Tax=Striga hermonthica TaxID=68872 RepID=A0A9N7R1Q6_STRHE|nr:Zinc-binding dehydrogenase family protein [Striga hermonthica]